MKKVYAPTHEELEEMGIMRKDEDSGDIGDPQSYIRWYDDICIEYIPPTWKVSSQSADVAFIYPTSLKGIKEFISYFQEEDEKSH